MLNYFDLRLGLTITCLCTERSHVGKTEIRVEYWEIVEIPSGFIKIRMDFVEI